MRAQDFPWRRSWCRPWSALATKKMMAIQSYCSPLRSRCGRFVMPQLYPTMGDTANLYSREGIGYSPGSRVHS